MKESFKKIIKGYKLFRNKYVLGEKAVMQHLAKQGQKPKLMCIACCDSRVDPALILNISPGESFTLRNVANIVPPWEKRNPHPSTSAALEFAIRVLEVEHLIILGHSQCGGIQALMEENSKNDFINQWVSIIKKEELTGETIDECAKSALHQSYKNCLTFPWIKEKVLKKELQIHLWFFDIKSGQIFDYFEGEFKPLDLHL